MVSLRRRRLLGLCSGVQKCVVDPQVMTCENGNNAAENDGIICSNTSNTRHMLLDDLNLPPREVDDPYEECGAPSTVGCSQPKEEFNNQTNFCITSTSNDPTQEEEVLKRRKQYRRKGGEKHVVPMRGVYMKNHKWQAAIKVDKKQIHLGTLNSQEEAVHLYDRAAFICGREPNLELSKEEKQELRNLKWDDFLAMTRSAIASKRTRRRFKTPTVHSVHNSDDEGEQPTEPLSPDDNAEPEKSTS